MSAKKECNCYEWKTYNPPCPVHPPKNERLAALREVQGMVEMLVTEAKITSQYAKGFYMAKGHIHDGIMALIKREEKGR